MLGDLNRYSGASVESFPSMHDTNSAAENWEKIMKRSILHDKKRLRPADFIIRFNKTRRGRLREYKMAKSSLYSQDTQRKAKKRKRQATNDAAEEIWKEKSGKKGKNFGKRKKDVQNGSRANNDKTKDTNERH